MKKKKNLKLKFDKNFFAALLHESARKLHYAFLVFDEGERKNYCPALTVDGITKFAFNIPNDMFVQLSNRHHIEKAQVIKAKGKVIFKNENAEIELSLASFYRHYATRFVNETLLN